MTPLITLFLRLPPTKRNGFVLFMENIRRIFIYLDLKKDCMCTQCKMKDV